MTRRERIAQERLIEIVQEAFDEIRLVDEANNWEYNRMSSLAKLADELLEQ